MLKYYLCCYINYNQDNWVWWISFVQFVYNNIKHNVMRQTLTKILFKTQSQLCIDVDMNNKYFKVKKAADCVTSLQNVYA